MKYVASCSCGKDSLAMVLTLLEKDCPLDYVLFVDLGKEFQSIYNAWNVLTQLLDRGGVKYKRLTPDKTFDYYFSEHEVKTRDGSSKIGYSWCGSGRARWGTEFKKRLLSNFYKETFGDEAVAEYVGIASDELSRVKIERGKNIKLYPLILWGMTENDCLVKCYKYGFTYLENNGVQLYQVLDRVSCYCCANKNLEELRAIYHKLPVYWDKLKEMQERTKRPFRDNFSIHELELRFKKEEKT